jgi:hypothetical protein
VEEDLPMRHRIGHHRDEAVRRPVGFAMRRSAWVTLP